MTKPARRIKVQPTTCRLMKTSESIPELDDWLLSYNGAPGIEIVYMVPNELVEYAERLGAVKMMKDEL